jgi:hypothetical protein
MKPLAGEQGKTSLYRTRTTTKSGGSWVRAIVIRDYDGGPGDNKNDDDNNLNDISH